MVNKIGGTVDAMPMFFIQFSKTCYGDEINFVWIWYQDEVSNIQGLS